jgi:hypothetical protein
MRIDGRVRKIVLGAIPAEMVSFFLLMMFPLDVGLPPGANPIWYVTLIGVWIHTPFMMIHRWDNLRPELLFPALILWGYITIVLAALLLWFLYRLLTKAISTR